MPPLTAGAAGGCVFAAAKSPPVTRRANDAKIRDARIGTALQESGLQHPIRNGSPNTRPPPSPRPPPHPRPLRPGMLPPHPPHRPRRGRIKMPPPLPRHLPRPHQLQVRLVHQHRRAERVPPPLRSHHPLRLPPELLV